MVVCFLNLVLRADDGIKDGVWGNTRGQNLEKENNKHTANRRESKVKKL